MTPRWADEAKRSLAFLRMVLLAGVVATLALTVWLILPPTPAPLPRGATALELQTQPTGLGARLVLGCPAAAFPDMRVARDGSALAFIRVDGAGGAETAIGPGGRLDPIWPPGWSARLDGGRGELVNPEGDVVAREGDVIRRLGGGSGMVCLTIGSRVAVEPAAP